MSPSFEARVDADTIDELLGDTGGSDGDVGYAVTLETTTGVNGVNGTPASVGSEYPLVFEVRTPVLALPTDDVAIDRIELTRSVQTATNSLPVVRDKAALARGFVTHDNAETTTVQVTDVARRRNGIDNPRLDHSVGDFIF